MSGLQFCFKTNNDFLREKHGNRDILVQKVHDSEDLRTLIKDPERFLLDAELLKDSRTTKAGIVKVDASSFFVKRSNNKGLRFTLRYLFRMPRAFRAWQAAWFLRRLDVPTPANFAAVSVRSGPILNGAYLITEVLQNVVPTLEFYRMMAEDNSLAEDLVDHAMKYIAPLHNWGIRHRDLKLSNIYVSRSPIPNSPSPFSYGFWDLDGIQLTNKLLSNDTRSDDLARLPASFKEIGKQLALEINAELIKDKIRDSYKFYSGFDVNMDVLAEREQYYIRKREKRYP